jgi:hypothetical protein
MKVKSFKLLPGVKHQGVDNEALHSNAPLEHLDPAGSTDGPIADETSPRSPIPNPVYPSRRPDVNSRKFQDKFVLSVDGERYNPGHGIICEVHQGLATFLCDSSTMKFQPTSLLDPLGSATKGPEEDDGDDAKKRTSKWMEEMARRLKSWQGQGKSPEETGEGSGDGGNATGGNAGIPSQAC